MLLLIKDYEVILYCLIVGTLEPTIYIYRTVEVE